MSRISVLGAGAFGTAYAVSLAREGREVVLWARDPGDMQQTRENRRRLPGVHLPEGVTVTGNFAHAAAADIVLLAIPLQKLSGVLAEHADQISTQALVSCAKGIDVATGRGPAEIIAEFCPGATPAILSGPSFAIDIAVGLPTALTLAADNPEPLQKALSTANIRLYRSTDMIGVELGGALKNVIAIACGITIGAGLGESARAALMTRGYAEMSRFAQARGARAETLAGLSGFGDLALTCTSEKSRNYSYGLALGRGQPGPEGATIEGKATARAVVDAARKLEMEMPIAGLVMALVSGAVTTDQAVEALLSRPLKENDMYAIICTDKDGALEVRKANRDAHLAYAAATPVIFAGPFQTEDGDMTGSLLVVDVETRAEAEAWAADDPYARAGLFQKVRIERFRKVIG